MSLTLVLGGTRSGKSAVAERLAVAAAGGGPVTYVATGSATDADMEARIDAHRRRRPAQWVTIEVGPGGDLPAAVAALPGVVLLDSLGTWVAGRWDEAGGDFDVDGGHLATVTASREGDSLVVGEEIGMSLHAPSEVGRRFVDAVGAVNQAVAAVADRVLLVVAGRVLEL